MVSISYHLSKVCWCLSSYLTITSFFPPTPSCRYKDNGQNFYVKLPLREKAVSDVKIPEDLVQIQAYLRWERNGKQTYTPEQEKASY